MRIGYIIKTVEGLVVARVGQYAGEGTINIAEYFAIIAALRHAFRLGFTSVAIETDAQLVARQLSGHYKVKDRKMRRLHREVKDLIPAFSKVTIKWVKRDGNREADDLSRRTVFEQAYLGPIEKSGGRHPRAMRSWQAARVRECAKRGVTEYALARIFAVPATSIRLIRLNRSYNDATLDGTPEWDKRLATPVVEDAEPFPPPSVFTTFPEDTNESSQVEVGAGPEGVYADVRTWISGRSEPVKN